MPNYWALIMAGFQHAGEGLQQAREGLVLTGEGLQQAINGFVEAGDAVRFAHAEQEDLRETVARLEQLVLQQSRDIQDLRTRLNGGE